MWLRLHSRLTHLVSITLQAACPRARHYHRRSQRPLMGPAPVVRRLRSCHGHVEATGPTEPTSVQLGVQQHRVQLNERNERA